MIRLVDVEASSLADGSFPIEVAWVTEDGQGETYLIRPTDAWLASAEDPLIWDEASERLHGITIAELLERGARPEYVATRAAQALAGRHVLACSDAPNADRRWLDLLLQAGGVRHRVHLEHVHHLYGLSRSPSPPA